MTRIRRPSLRWSALAVALLTVTGLAAGCATAGPGRPAGPDGNGGARGRVVEVVAAENFWGSIAAALGGDHAHVVSVLTNPDTDPHDYEPTAADARTVARARYVIENGVGYDPWMARLVAADGTSGRRVLDIGHRLGLKTGANPHRWYYPADVAKVVDLVTGDLQALDPADAAYFTARRADYTRHGLARYDDLLHDIATTYRGTSIGASESIVVGLAQAAGLDLRTPASYLNAMSEGDEPTAADKATVDRQIASGQIAVFIYNRQNATPDVRTVVASARAHHVPVVTVTETMVPPTSTFAAWQVGQLDALASALAKATGR